MTGIVQLPPCIIRQYSDMTACRHCGQTWDTNDPEPPGCPLIPLPVGNPPQPRSGHSTGSAEVFDRAGKLFAVLVVVICILWLLFRTGCGGCS